MKAFKATLIYWKLAIARCGIKAILALFASIGATLNGVEWDSLTATKQFFAVASAIGAALIVIDAFLDNTMARIKEKEEKERLNEPSPTTG